jgi:Ni,Fe-hydrogenase III large subunit
MALSDDGVFEPGEELEFESLKLINRGVMEMPETKLKFSFKEDKYIENRFKEELDESLKGKEIYSMKEKLRVNLKEVKVR